MPRNAVPYFRYLLPNYFNITNYRACKVGNSVTGCMPFVEETWL
jgi:hypothetical protein